LEIIWISYDKEEKEYKSYLNRMPWLTLDFKDNLSKTLKSKYSQGGIPNMTILKRNGTTHKVSCQQDLGKGIESCLMKWLKI